MNAYGGPFPFTDDGVSYSSIVVSGAPFGGLTAPMQVGHSVK